MDMEMLKKLMAKKGQSDLNPEYKSAKMGVLSSLHKQMGDMMGDDVKGLKKVTVAAPDKGGLAEGLDKAKEMLGVQHGEELGGNDNGSDEGSEDEEASESPEMEASEDESSESDELKSPEDIDAKIQELLKMKEKMHNSNKI